MEVEEKYISNQQKNELQTNQESLETNQIKKQKNQSCGDISNAVEICQNVPKKRRICKDKTNKEKTPNTIARISNSKVAKNTINSFFSSSKMEIIPKEMVSSKLSELAIPEELKMFLFRQLRQTVSVVKEILPQHKFLLFGEITLDMDLFVHKLKIREIEDGNMLFDRFRPVLQCIKYPNRVEFDLDGSYQGLTEFQYIIDALKSMHNQMSLHFADVLQNYQQVVRDILQKNNQMKQIFQSQTNERDQQKRLNDSFKKADEIINSLNAENEVFIYSIISKRFDGLSTIKRGFSKGLLKGLDVSEEEFIRSVRQNKVYNTILESFNHGSVLQSQQKMEENPYMKLRQHEVMKRIHPDFIHNNSNQFQKILNQLVRQTVIKQEIAQEFVEDSNATTQDLTSNFLPNPLPSFSQYQKFIKNLNPYQQSMKMAPEKQIELFRNITSVLTKKNSITCNLNRDQSSSSLDYQMPQSFSNLPCASLSQRDIEDNNINSNVNLNNNNNQISQVICDPQDIEKVTFSEQNLNITKQQEQQHNNENKNNSKQIYFAQNRSVCNLQPQPLILEEYCQNSDSQIKQEDDNIDNIFPPFLFNQISFEQENNNPNLQFLNQSLGQKAQSANEQLQQSKQDHEQQNQIHKEGQQQSSQQTDKPEKSNKIKDFYEQLLQYIGDEEEQQLKFDDQNFQSPYFNPSFKENVIKEYEQLRSLLEDGKYMPNEEYNEFLNQLKSQPPVKKKQYLKYLMKIPDLDDYKKREERKRLEEEVQRFLDEYFEDLDDNPEKKLVRNTKLANLIIEEYMKMGTEGLTKIFGEKIANLLCHEGIIEVLTEVISSNPYEEKSPVEGKKQFRRISEVIKKVYELNNPITLQDSDIKINEYLEVFYIGKTKLWKNFSQDFVLNNSFRDLFKEQVGLQKNQFLNKFYPEQAKEETERILRETMDQKASLNKTTTQDGYYENNDSLNGQDKCNKSKQKDMENNQVNNSYKYWQHSETQQKIDKELVEKIINQFKMGPPHPFKVLLTLKKALQKIVKFVDSKMLSQSFLKNVLKMIVFLLQGNTKNYIKCRQRVPIDAIESIEIKILKKISQISII